MVNLLKLTIMFHCILMYMLQISKWDSHKNTYGWARAEVLGALSNSVFLIALCFTIFVEALERLTHTEEIKDPNLLLIVGSLGLLINILGLFLFAGHAHSHGGGGHGHSHGGSHTHTANNTTTGVLQLQRLVYILQMSEQFLKCVLLTYQETMD